MMRIHRWWLALLAALLTPWLGPHIDDYLPVGWLLLQAHAEAPDAGFWVIAGVLLGVAYVAWLVLLSAITAWFAHRRRDRGRSSGHA
jgi:heme/copper-type cytochrome/quinol oxidase subunit 2